MASKHGISLGILGTGAFAQCFIPLFQAHPLVSQVALCDQHEPLLRESAARHGVSRTFSSFEQLLASDVQAIAIFTQHWAHAPQAIQALKAGKDVYSAVPMAASRAEVDELMRTVDARSGPIYMMGETSAYYAEAIYCRERFLRGDFGPASSTPPPSTCMTGTTVSMKWGNAAADLPGGPRRVPGIQWPIPPTR